MNSWDTPTRGELWFHSRRRTWLVLRWLVRLVFTRHWYWDPEHGDDANTGRSRRQAMRTHDALIARLPMELRRPHTIHVYSNSRQTIALGYMRFQRFGQLSYYHHGEPTQCRVEGP